MHMSFQKNKFHDHTIRILEIRRVGTGGGHMVSPPPRSSVTILDQEEREQSNTLTFGQKYTKEVIQWIPLILGTNTIFEKIMKFRMITIKNIEFGRNSNLLQRKWKNVFFFRHICNRFNMMHDGCIIFHIFFLLGLKFLQNEKFSIFDHFSTSYGASKSKNVGFCTKNGKGFFLFHFSVKSA